MSLGVKKNFERGQGLFRVAYQKLKKLRSIIDDQKVSGRDSLRIERKRLDLRDLHRWSEENLWVS